MDAVRLATLFEEGRAAWPEVELSLQDFSDHMARGLGPAGELTGLHAADLYLACGAALGLVPAVFAFERAVLSQVPKFLARMKPSEVEIDEIRQTLREKLLMARPEGPPRIADYAGRGPLVAWVRVTALREALLQRRRQEGEPPAKDDMLAALPAAGEPELDHIRERCKDAFADAFRQAVSELTIEQRNLLRMYFADELGSAQIAATFQVNRSTVVRWLQTAREALRDGTRRILRERLRLSESDMQSMVGLVYSRVDVSIAGFLRETE